MLSREGQLVAKIARYLSHAVLEQKQRNSEGNPHALRLQPELKDETEQGRSKEVKKIGEKRENIKMTHPESEMTVCCLCAVDLFLCPSIITQ